MIQIKMFTDIICEWCYLARNILDTLHDSYDFKVDCLWYEIHPETPPLGIPMKQHNIRYKHFFKVLNERGAPYGLELACKEHFANTHHALLMMIYAREAGKGGSFLRSVWDAYMKQGHDISTPEQVAELALSVGISPAGIQQAFSNPHYADVLEHNYQLSLAYDTKSVPAFIVNNEYLLTGVQSHDTWEQLFDKILRDNKEMKQP